MAKARRKRRSTSASGRTASATTGTRKRRRKGARKVKGKVGKKNALGLPKKGTTLAGLTAHVRQLTHRVNQHHTAIHRLEKACVTKGILSGTTKFTRLKGR